MQDVMPMVWRRADGFDAARAGVATWIGASDMPRHTHGDREMLIVLDGGYRDEIGVYDVGDVALAGLPIRHNVRARAHIMRARHDACRFGIRVRVLVR